MYSVEWQKRGLPHAHILIWLLNKLHSNEVDDIISAEIPDPVTDPRLHDIVTTQMVHGPCGALNPLSPCMADGKCTKRYPRPLVAETVTGNDGYPVYRRRSKEDNGRTIKVKVQNQEIEIGNEFIVPYCLLLPRIFETHANVESCHSAKSIKYLCKYVTKGSDMAVFGIASENANDEISNFQMGRYVTVHLENGQRVYFTEANAAQRAERPPSTTLTSFFAMCEADTFTATLMYVEMPKYYTWNQSTKKFQRRKQGTPVPDWPQVFSTDALGPKQVYETLMQAVDNNTGGLFFLDAPGGTGKTFVISLILATIRSRCDIALALASSGIAATLLDGGRTAHSALKLPLNLNTIDTPTCNISRSSAMGKLLMQCKLIVWDECTMAHKKSLEALNFTLKDLRRNNNIFGGLMILLAGDFRQTLPVVPRGTPADELNACLKASPLWNNVKKLSLTTNMRVQLQNDQSAAQFSKQLLDVGNGKVPVDATSGLITLTNDFCRFVDTQLVLIENVFPNISENYKNYAWLSQRAILAAKNNDVHALNFTIQSKLLAIW
ncbi:ATP-dependent DNA helicase pif1 [Eumeta japonica]|uniref:ATP-dependent DNA helicase n=1 Tax=Eumeta variegata TaxID=151549 RepID=A0A4C1ZM60_EUMVA|nr:ATP-dependent DNA helicase pif1 [Eumeta japonica]